MTDQSSNELLKASRLIEKLVRRSTQLKPILTVDREQEELFKQLETGLQRLQRLVSNAMGKDLTRKRSTQLWVAILGFFIRIIELLSKIVK